MLWKSNIVISGCDISEVCQSTFIILPGIFILFFREKSLHVVYRALVIYSKATRAFTDLFASVDVLGDFTGGVMCVTALVQLLIAVINNSDISGMIITALVRIIRYSSQ